MFCFCFHKNANLFLCAQFICVAALSVLSRGIDAAEGKGVKKEEKGMLIYNCSDSHNRNNGNLGSTNDWDSVLNFGNSYKAVVTCLFLSLLH